MTLIQLMCDVDLHNHHLRLPGVLGAPLPRHPSPSGLGVEGCQEINAARGRLILMD